LRLSGGCTHGCRRRVAANAKRLKARHNAGSGMGPTIACVMVLADGFAWNGQTYDSLTKVAFAITGTRWNGPRFFGLRDRQAKSLSEAGR
jgi:Protein of unknown function (DUF2924)